MKKINTYILEKLYLNDKTEVDLSKYYDKLCFPIINEYIFGNQKFKFQHDGYSIVGTNGKIKIIIGFHSNFEGSKEIETFKEKLLEHIKKEDSTIDIKFSWNVNHNLEISFNN